jgi:antitoxin HigA-1
VSHRSLPPVTPGEILEEEFLKPLKITQYRLAKDISVPPRRINEIIRGTRAVTADTAIRLARYFGMSEGFWLNLQTHYDIESTKQRLGGRLQNEVRVRLAYYPPRLTIEGRKVFVQMEDGKNVRVTPKAARKYGKVLCEAIARYVDGQGKAKRD